MKVLKWLVIIVVALVAAVFAVGLTLPNTLHVERSGTIGAPAAAIYTQLDNFRNFNKWSPWAQYDPNAQYTIEGPARGLGARQSWSGNKEVGTGSQEIIEAKPYSLVKTRLVFGGFESNQYTASFELSPEGEGTKVRWVLDGEFGGNILNKVMSRYFAKYASDMIGDDYDKGLANLRQLAEALPKPDFSTLVVEEVEVQPVAIATVAGHSTTEVGAIGGAYAEAYAKILGFMKATGLKEAGPPIAITRKWDEQAKLFEFDAGIPVDRSDVNGLSGEVRLAQTYGGKALKVTHTGSYDALPKTYEMLKAYTTAYGYEKNGNEWEQYVSDPGSTLPAERVTLIYYPVK